MVRAARRPGPHPVCDSRSQVVELADVRMVLSRNRVLNSVVETLMATARSILVSRARHTSPMAPIGARISYGPSFAPGESGTRVDQLSLTHPGLDRS